MNRVPVRRWLKKIRFLIQTIILYKPTMYIFNSPEHKNLGDHAIAYAEKKYLEQFFSEFRIVEITQNEWVDLASLLQKRIKESDVIFFNGGGYMGNLWPSEVWYLNSVVSAFPHIKKIVFPQSIYYTEDKLGNEKKSEDSIFYNVEKKLWIIAREKKSWDIMTKEIGIPKDRCALYPDMVLDLSIPVMKTRDKLILCSLRKDKEKKIQGQKVEAILFNELQNEYKIGICDNIAENNVSIKERERVLEKQFDKISKAQIIITDRLHIMLFAAITGTPCIAFDNLTQKISGVYEWIKELEYIFLMDEGNFTIEFVKQILNNKKKYYYPQKEMEKYFLQLKDYIKNIVYTEVSVENDEVRK